MVVSIPEGEMVCWVALYCKPSSPVSLKDKIDDDEKQKVLYFCM